MNQISAILLAGGLSSRMGVDKATLPFQGSTLLEWQLRKLNKLGIKDILLSGREAGTSEVRCVLDEFPRCGPLGGIHACLKQAQFPSWVTGTVPMFMMTEAHITDRWEHLIPAQPRYPLQHVAVPYSLGLHDLEFCPGQPPKLVVDSPGNRLLSHIMARDPGGIHLDFWERRCRDDTCGRENAQQTGRGGAGMRYGSWRKSRKMEKTKRPGRPHKRAPRSSVSVCRNSL